MDTIHLNDLYDDLDQLIDQLILNKMDAISIQYTSDIPELAEIPTPLEIAAFKTTKNLLPGARKPAETTQMMQQAATQLLTLVNLADDARISSIAQMFARIQKAGKFLYFVPSDHGWGFSLIYGKYTFVFIVNQHPQIQYSLL